MCCAYKMSISDIFYFSAEIGLSSSIPTYSGGLGVLAGDHVKAAADTKIPVVGMTLLYRHGQGIQRIDKEGDQRERWNSFNPNGILTNEDCDFEIELGSEKAIVQVWSKTVSGVTGHSTKVYFLDVGHERNKSSIRELGNRLYGGGTDVRIRQEYILGIGGVIAIKKLDLWPIRGIHLNEGHTAFAALGLMDEGLTFEEVKEKLHFTTHTPVPAGHDVFEFSEAEKILGKQHSSFCKKFASNGKLSMSHLAINVSQTCNAVSKLNAKVASEMFPDKKISPITNGVHHLTWTSAPLAKLYDSEIPSWRENPSELKKVYDIDDEKIFQSHLIAKKSLLRYANSMSGRGLSSDLLTICFARRMVEYKRPNLILKDIERLTKICANKVQFVFAGYAHPNNTAGKKIIKELNQATELFGESINFVYLENYSMWLGSKLVSGADIWLNNPVRPLEACGTSGMKAAMNGGLNLSISDGWWDEEARDGENGWIIGDKDVSSSDEEDAESIYDKLENEIIPLWENNREGWIRMMKNAIATSSLMTAERMVKEYEEYYKLFSD